MIRTVVTSPPAVEPVTLAEAKAHLRVTIDADDDYIEALIAVARLQCESHLGQSFINKSLTCYADHWYAPARPGRCGDYRIPLPCPPVAAVSAVRYLGADRTTHTLDPSLYRVLPGFAAMIVGNLSTAWPSLWDAPEAVEVDYTAGYGPTAADVPAVIRHAIKMCIGNWYENREPAVIGAGLAVQPLPMGVAALLGAADHGGWRR